MSLAPYSFSTAVGSWTLDLPVLVAVLLALLAYAGGVRAAHRRGHAWPWWRTALFAAAGLGGVVVCTMSSLAVYDHTYLWALAAQLTLLMSLVPVGIALGDPVGLARVALAPTGRARLERALRSLPVRVLTFPVVSAVLAVTVTMVVFFSGLLGSALRDGPVLDLVYLVVLVVGLLAALPLLGAEILPAWCTEPFRLLFASVDGLLDAVPGIAVMGTSAHLAGGWFDRVHGSGLAFLGTSTDPRTDVHVAGALMLALTEVVTLPVVVILFFRWASRETTRDRQHLMATAPRPTAVPQQPEQTRPWWETEGMGRRNPGWRTSDDGGA